MVSCREFLRLFLDGWLSRELPRRRQQACDAHLARCRACSNYVDSYTAMVRLLRADSLTVSAPVPEELVQAILRGSR